MSRQLFTAVFWADAFERSVKTFAYTMIGALPVTAATTSATGVPWADAALTGLSAAAISLLGSVASLKFGRSGTASLTKAVEPARSDSLE